MSIQYNCDGGCGECTEDRSGFKERGISLKRHYCEKCDARMEEYQKELNLLHTQAAETLQKKVAALRAKLIKDAPNGKLPDVE